MSLQFKPLHPVFVAEASGIDLTRPLSLDEIKQFNAGMNRYGVLVIRGQPLTGQQQIDFAQSFGPLDTTLKRVFKRPERLEDERRIDISNVDAKGAVAGRASPRNLSNFANQLWHSDSSFMKPRAAYSMLHAVVLPSWGGNTEFADLRAAWDALDERTRRDIEGLEAEHYALHTRLLLGDEAYTDEQKKQVQAILEEDRASRQGPSASMTLRRDLEAEILSDSPDEQTIETLRQQLVQAQGEELSRHIAVQRKIAQILTAEQRATARERLSQPRPGRGH